MPKSLYFTMGLTILLIGCESPANPEVNSTIPQTGQYDANAAKKAGGPPQANSSKDAPGGYPTGETEKKDTAKDSESKEKDSSKEGEKKDQKASKDGAQATEVKLSDEEIAGINKLADPKDRELALAQKVCPISGENLGGMGAPIKVVADGKTAFLCCKGCKKDFDKDPKAALAKISK